MPILFTDYILSLKLIPIIASTLMIYYIGDYFPIGIDINKKTKYRAFAALIAMTIGILSKNIIATIFFGLASYWTIIFI